MVRFVADTAQLGSPGYVPPAERIATFDNDGTLWTVHPMCVEVLFARDRIRAMAAQNPSWRNEMPFKAVVDGNDAELAKLPELDFFRPVAAMHAGRMPAQFRQDVADWLAVTKHPPFNRPCTKLVYQPMPEVLALSRATATGPTSRPAAPSISSEASPKRSMASRRSR